MKPGYKTTEFWMTALSYVAAAIVASGVDSPVVKVASFVAAALTTLGYQAGRAYVKSKAE